MSEPSKLAYPVSDSIRTDWHCIHRARENGAVRNELIIRYMERIAERVQRKWASRLGPNVQDVVQDFLVKMLDGPIIKNADPSKGKFRSYLNRCIDHHVIDKLRQLRPDIQELFDIITTPTEDPDIEADMLWAEEVFHEAVSRLAQLFTNKGYNDIWEVARLRYVDPILHGTAPDSVEELAKRLNAASVNVIIGKARTARKWLKSLVREVIAELDPIGSSELDAEMEALIKLLARRLHIKVENFSPMGVLYSNLLPDLEDFDRPRWLRIVDQFFNGEAIVFTYDDLLHHENPPRELLVFVKDFARQQRDEREPVLSRHVADFLYTMTAALGLITCEKPISRLGPEVLLDNFARLRQQLKLDARYNERCDYVQTKLKSLVQRPV